jgi:hypothetical protein
MLVKKELMVVGAIVGVLVATADSSTAALPEAAEEVPAADATRVEPAKGTETGLRPGLISTASGRYEAWLTPMGGTPVKVAEWIDGVTKDFSWRIPADTVGGYRVFRLPTTIGAWGERANDNKDCWIYMDDFAMASSEEALPEYSE